MSELVCGGPAGDSAKAPRRGRQPMSFQLHDYRHGSASHGSATMSAPVPSPPDSSATLDYGTRQVPEARRDAPGRRPRAAGGPVGYTSHCRGSHADVPSWQLTPGPTQDPHQPIARLHTAHRRARLARPARVIDFTGGDAGDTYLRSFGTPNRAVTIPYCRRRTGEWHAGSNDLHGESEDHWASVSSSSATESSSLDCVVSNSPVALSMSVTTSRQFSARKRSTSILSWDPAA